MSESNRTVSETIDYILSVLTDLHHEGLSMVPIRFADKEDDNANPDHDYRITVIIPVSESDPVDNTTACMVVKTTVNIHQLRCQSDKAFGASLANLMTGILDSLGEREATNTTGVTIHNAQLDTTTH